MQAIVYESYGPPDVLKIKDLPTPAPKDNEVLVRVLSVSFKTRHLLQMLRSSFGGRHKMLCVLAPGKVDDLRAVRELIESGALKAHIAQRFAFADAPAAHRLVEEGKHTGAVVITFA